MKFESKYKTVHWPICIWIIRLWNGGHFVQWDKLSSFSWTPDVPVTRKNDATKTKHRIFRACFMWHTENVDSHTSAGETWYIISFKKWSHAEISCFSTGIQDGCQWPYWQLLLRVILVAFVSEANVIPLFHIIQGHWIHFWDLHDWNFIFAAEIQDGCQWPYWK